MLADLMIGSENGEVIKKCQATAVFTSLPTKVDLWYGHCYTHVVEEAAARYDVDQFYSSQKDHFSVCRPTDEKDSGFQRLIELINIGMPSITLHPVASQTQDINKSESNRVAIKLLDALKIHGQGLSIQFMREDTEDFKVSRSFGLFLQ
ncbi:unnamed protein product [Calypogeia fissa]